MENSYFAYLSKNKTFQKVIEGTVPRELKSNKNPALFLFTSIINQQLSTKVGAVFYKRFLDLFEGNVPTSQQIIDTPIETLQSIGLSKSKAGYIQNVAAYDLEHGLGYDKLLNMTDAEVHAFVTAIKGIGNWSAQNLLMFVLGREDVFSGDDLIIQNAVALLYGLDKSDKKNFRLEMNRVSAQWSPYRTFACLHLWEWYHRTTGK